MRGGIMNIRDKILIARILCNSCSYQDGGWHCITELEELGYDACECDEYMKDKYRVDRNKERLKKWNNAKLKALQPKYEEKPSIWEEQDSG